MEDHPDWHYALLFLFSCCEFDSLPDDIAVSYGNDDEDNTAAALTCLGHVTKAAKAMSAVLSFFMLCVIFMSQHHTSIT